MLVSVLRVRPLRPPSLGSSALSILKAMSTTTSDIQARLAGFSTCEISDALLKLGSPHGGHIPDIHILSPSDTANTRICGPAYTVQMVLGSNKDAPKLSAHFVDTAQAGSVIVINAPDRSVTFPTRFYTAYTDCVGRYA